MTYKVKTSQLGCESGAIKVNPIEGVATPFKYTAATLIAEH